MRRQTLALATVFCGLAAASYMAVVAQPERGMSRLRLHNVAEGSVDTLSFSGAHSFTLSRANTAMGPWLLPNGHKADPLLVSQILQEIQGVNTSDLITQDTSRFIDLHVEGDACTTVELRQNKKVVARLHLGEANTQDTFYVREGDRVFRSKGMLVHLARRGQDDWEDRRLYNDAADQIASIAVRMQGVAAVNLVRSDDSWRPAQISDLPQGLRFDDQQAAGVARALADLRAGSLIDDPLDDSVTGLKDGDSVNWTFTAEGEARSQVHERTLLVGKPSKEGERYAQLAGTPQLYSVSTRALGAILKQWQDLRDLTIMHNEPFDDIVAVALTPKDQKAALTWRKGQQGTFVATAASKLPKGFVLDPAQLRKRSQQAMLARAIGYAGKQAQSHRIGTAGTGSIVLTGSGAKTQSLVFGRALKGDEGVGYYAKGSVDNDVYVISKALHGTLTAGAQSLAQKATAAPAAGPAANGLTPELEAQIRQQLSQSQPG